MRYDRMRNGTILWLTGWCMSHRVFDGLREALPDFSHISLDYSRAVSSEELWSMTESAARQHLITGEGPLLVGGWSLGGLLALRLAARRLTDGLILFGATAKFTRPKDQTSYSWADAYVRQMVTGVRRERQLVLHRGEEPGPGCGVEAFYHGHWKLSALLAGLELLSKADCEPLLPEIHCPVLLVHGTKDKICPYGAAEELYARLPQAKLVTLHGGGHAPFVGREADVAASVRSWWQGGQGA